MKLKLYILFILMLSFSFEGIAQYSDYKQSPIDQIKLQIDSARHYLKINNEKAFDFITKGFELIGTKSNQFETERSTLNEILGDLYVELGQYDLANEKYVATKHKKNKGRSKNITKSKEVDKVTFEPLKNTVALKLASGYILTNESKKSKTILQSINENSLSQTEQLEYYKVYGDLEKLSKNYTTAISYYEKGLNASKTQNQKNYEILFENNLALAKESIGNIFDAEIHYNNSMNNIELKDVSQQAEQIELNSNFYRNNANIDKEIKLRKQGVKNIEALPESNFNTQLLQTQNYKIADAYITKNEIKEAIPYLEKSIENAKVTKNIDIQIKATKELSSAYEKEGNIELAFQNYRNYVALTEKLYQSKELEIKDAVTTTSKLAIKQKRIDVLELNNEINESKIVIADKNRDIYSLDSRRQQNIIYGLVAGLILAIIALFFFYKNNKQKKLANNLLQLKSLKSQMNPHFIFNALNSVNNYIALNDERKANRYLTDFSKLMRMVLEVSEKDIIPLEREVELLKLYLALEHERFIDKFDYTFNIDKSISLVKMKIPPMLLQPYIENAVWHGMRYKKTKGKVDVSFDKTSNGVQITIKDDGIGRTESKKLKSQNQLKTVSKGMSNTQNRIEILNDMYGDWISIKISDFLENGTGTKVIVTLKDDI